MTAESAQKETRTFQTEVQKLLHLMVNALYSHREIFLRELISNSSDALDKLHFEGIKNETLFEGQQKREIRLQPDPDQGTLTVSDNGIGMDRDEVAENIGTIAHSSSQAFLERLTGDEKKDLELIGQFGVGFYSAFMVADRVDLLTRRAGASKEQGVHWSSDGSGSYTLETVTKEALGTEVTLHLKEDAQEYLEAETLRRVVQKYSDHISYPVILEGSEGEETLNSASALWARPKSEISEEDYRNFYAHISHGDTEPLAHLHIHAEGTTEYTALLYIPSHVPFDLWQPNARPGIRLYVRRVFITDEAGELIPHYLRFLRGVVDAPHLPLNISREMLQQDKQIERIRKGLVRRILNRLEEMTNQEPDRYERFWANFGAVLKGGLVEDESNQQQIAKLVRYRSSQRPDSWISLEDYKQNMQEGQKAIYYLTGDNLTTLQHSPHLEIFKKKGVEVLLMTDLVDEWAVYNLTEYEGTPLTSAARGELDLQSLPGGEEEQATEQQQTGTETFQGLLEAIQGSLSEAVESVRLSHRLTDSPSCIVTGENALGEQMERILRAANQPVPISKPILELNPDHPVLRRLHEIYTTQPSDPRIAEWAWLLLDQARLAQGSELPDPSGTARRMSEMMSKLAGEERSRIITP